jgi:hypothetical protein
LQVFDGSEMNDIEVLAMESGAMLLRPPRFCMSDLLPVYRFLVYGLGCVLLFARLCAVAVCCCVLLCAAVCCCVLLCAAVCCCVLLCAAVSCCVLL